MAVRRAEACELAGAINKWVFKYQTNDLVCLECQKLFCCSSYGSMFSLDKDPK